MRRRGTAVKEPVSTGHRLHSGERYWTETNCYVDVWIEVLHSLGFDPSAAGAFTLSTDFEGDQWTFFKYPPEDLRALYGIQVAEMNVWRPIAAHVAEQLQFGRLMTVEVDAFHLPDTVGISYGLEHVKTTVVPVEVDVPGRRLRYFHGLGSHELDGGDFDGIFGSDAESTRLPPYVELIRLDHAWHDEAHLLATAVQLTRYHLAQRPMDNPIVRMAERLESDVELLQALDQRRFHQYAFGTCRQCGATAEIAADFTAWLDEHDGGGLLRATQLFTSIASGAKVVQFNLARGARGRRFDLSEPLAEMAQAWEGAMAVLSDRYAG